MIEKVKNIINQYHMLSRGDSVLLALSGGADSVCLLEVLLLLKEEYELTLFAAHMNHNLRGEESDADENFVRMLCKEKNIPLFVKSVEIKKIAERKKQSTELVAREERYHFFEEVSEENHIQKIATAHNANDNAETVVFRLIRGTGISGLTGIPAVRGKIIRPLLFVNREEILPFLNANQLSYRIDSTNEENIFTRNKIRHKILPIAKEINPGFVETIAGFTDRMRETQEFLEDAAKKEFQNIVRIKKEGLSLPFEDFKNLPEGIKFPLLSLCTQYFGENLSTVLFEEIKTLILHNTVSKQRIIHDLCIRTGYGELIMEKMEKNSKSEFYCKELILPTGEMVSKRGKYRIAYALEEKNTEIVQKKLNTVYLDYDKIEDKIFVREREKGDIYFLNHDSGTKTLKKMMIDKKIPCKDRDEIPIFVSGGEILYIYGFPISEKIRANSDTKKILSIEISEVL